MTLKVSMTFVKEYVLGQFFGFNTHSLSQACGAREHDTNIKIPGLKGSFLFFPLEGPMFVKDCSCGMKCDRSNFPDPKRNDSPSGSDLKRALYANTNRGTAAFDENVCYLSHELFITIEMRNVCHHR